MKKYLLTIFNNVDDAAKWMAMSPEEQGAMMQEVTTKYMAYTQRLIDEGRHIASEGLSPVGKTFTPTENDIAVTDGPYVFAKELVGGFFYYTAENLEEAAAIARDCPALEYGSKVEIREQMDYGI